MKAAYFVSDAHLGLAIKGGEDREKFLLEFFQQVVADGSHLFIVGDLFDFWIEYRYAIRPDYFPALHGLRSLVDAGVQVHYCQGNHDFALGPFISSTLGVIVHQEEFRGELQGRNLLVCHGDGLRPQDWSGRFLRNLLRNPVLQAGYRLLPPVFGVKLGEFISGLSRRCELAKADDVALAAYRFAAQKFIDQGSDLVVFGHTHEAELVPLVGGIYCNTGNWVRRLSFARLLSGEMELFEYLPGRGPVPWREDPIEG